MSVLRRITILGLVTIMSCVAFGQSSPGKGNCETVHGKGLAFRVCAPEGWVLDSRIKHDIGILAAFYPKGSTWDKAKESGSVMYVSTAGKRPGMDTVEALMNTDAEQTQVLASGVQITKDQPIGTDGGDKAAVQRFEHSTDNRSEAVAYLNTPKAIVMFSISSKDDTSFQADYGKFVAMVKSWKLVSD